MAQAQETQKLRRLGLLRQHVRPKELEQSVELFQAVLPSAWALGMRGTMNPGINLGRTKGPVARTVGLWELQSPQNTQGPH